MVEKDSEVIEENQTSQVPNNEAIENLLDTDLLLLLFILIMFFQKNDDFSEYFKVLKKHTNKIKGYLDTADSTLQALNEASKIPKEL